MNLTAGQRETFRQAAGLILPAWKSMPGAGRLGIETRQLDQALAARPDLEGQLVRILHSLTPPVDAVQIAALHNDRVQDFAILRTVVCGAYYLHPDARKALSYPGQQALTLSRGGFGGEDLVMKMMEQPKRFRPA